jgi:RND family efflux transporter MFP subunit
MIARSYGQEARKGNTKDDEKACFLALADEKDFPHKGKIDFVDTQVDASTGTLTIRAVFPNKSGILFPGLFVRLRVPLQKREALLITNLAVGIDQGGRYVLVVNNENVVEQRIVTIGQEIDGLRVIESGLAPDDWVITNGVQLARPGTKVTPIKASGSTTEPSRYPPNPPAEK